MAEREDVSKHGIRRVTTLKPKSGGRQCVVPWKKRDGGMKDKRRFKTEEAAQKFCDKNDPTMRPYKCKFHKCYHVGHPPKEAVSA